MGLNSFLFEIIALVINFFAPIVFSFDTEKEYVPAQARYITLTAQVVLFAITNLFTLFNARKVSGKSRLHHRAVGVCGLMMTVFIILQTLYPLLPFYSVGCLLGTCVIHTFVVADEREERTRELGTARQKAYRDALTKVMNRTAYLEMKQQLDLQIQSGEQEAFGVIVLDVNDLKTVNDTQGHEAGDRYIQAACKMICNTYKHSPVYRIGGDEFAVFLKGDDYENREKLAESFDALNEINQNDGFVVVAWGMDEYRPVSDLRFDDVFERADKKMYTRKKMQKEEVS